MAKAKVARKSTAIDMTPMVDLAFLLITFFMLTVKFRPTEAIEVAMPSSIAKTPLPEKDVMVISVSKDGKLFLRLTSQVDRATLIDRVIKRKPDELGNLTEAEKKKFKLVEDFGGSFAQARTFINASPEERKKMVASPTFKGIPYDSTDNQFDVWLYEARKTNPNMRIAIKADQETPYPVIAEVIKTLKKRKAHKFNLITSQEADPRITGKKPE
jgi:biopolymer transport protein ExbD